MSGIVMKVKKKPDFFVWLRSSLRKISQRHPPIYSALAAAKRPYTGDNPRQRVCFECAKCKGLFSSKQVAVDHRTDCGSLKSWDDVQGFMERLFCGEEGLDVLCSECHDKKSYMTKHNVSEEEAEIQKYVINLLKSEQKSDIILFIESWDFNEEYLTGNEAQRRKALVEIFRNIYKGE